MGDCWMPHTRLEYELRHNNWVQETPFRWRRDIPNHPPIYVTCDRVDWKAFCWVSNSEGVPTGRSLVELWGQVPEQVQGICRLPVPCPSPSPGGGNPCPSPSPSPSPGTSPSPGPPQPGGCPPLKRVGGGLFNCQLHGVPIDCSTRVFPVGAEVVIDTTHHFGRRSNASCDEPTDWACGGRLCSGDGTLFIVERGQGCEPQGTHQLDCKRMKAGQYRVRACAKNPYQSTSGDPVDVSDVECTLMEWVVQ